MKFATAYQNGTRKVEDHEDAPKPPGGALFWRNAGSPLANYELKPRMEAEGTWPMLHWSMAIK